ncbi:enterobactin transporter EntS [Kineococcus sp. TBRC 1896]|uniref:Enterobactin transporter EntS n=1 Tax=Kineococcus mangrovi TaxID=1660183 RepID=A0ABV4I447_9ACTN
MSRLLDLSGWAVDLTPLRVNRQFRLLFTGRLVSVFGLGMLAVVLSVQVYDLTGSSLQVAAVNTVLGTATLLGSLAGGVLADRVDRRKVVLVSRALAVAGFVALALNATAEHPSVAVLYVFAVWDGATGAVGASAFGAAVPAVVPPSMLPATGALMALCLDLGSVAAPLVAGFVTGAGGPAAVYWSVVAVSTASWLVLFRLDPVVPERSAGQGPDARTGWAVGRAVADLREGFAFARSDRVVGGVLLVGFLQIFFASPHVLVPEFVGDDLGGGPEAVGLVYAAPAAGALLAGVCSGWIPRVRRTGVLLVVVPAVSALAVAAFGLAPAVWFAVVAMTVVGVTDVIGEVLRFTVLAERTPDRLRGRVQSIWSAQVTVGDTLGGPLLALGARAFGTSPVIAVGGLFAAVTTLVLLLTRPELRRHTSGGAPGTPHEPENEPPHEPHENLQESR